MTTVDEILEHHGVKGMKWGVRRKSPAPTVPSGPESVTLKVSPGGGVTKAQGGGGHMPSEDAIKAAVIRQVGGSSTVHSLSNQELQTLVTRLNLEQQYRKLVVQTKKKKKGQVFVESLLSVGGSVAKQQGTKLANDITAKKIAAIMEKQAAKAAAKAAGA